MLNVLGPGIAVLPAARPLSVPSKPAAPLLSPLSAPGVLRVTPVPTVRSSPPIASNPGPEGSPSRQYEFAPSACTACAYAPVSGAVVPAATRWDTDAFLPP